jgi:hypothetical protein
LASVIQQKNYILPFLSVEQISVLRNIVSFITDGKIHGLTLFVAAIADFMPLHIPTVHSYSLVYRYGSIYKNEETRNN